MSYLAVMFCLYYSVVGHYTTEFPGIIVNFVIQWTYTMKILAN